MWSRWLKSRYPEWYFRRGYMVDFLVSLALLTALLMLAATSLGLDASEALLGAMAVTFASVSVIFMMAELPHRARSYGQAERDGERMIELLESIDSRLERIEAAQQREEPD